ncbi:hypothetical protein SAMN05216480_108116 [Pustulibacterium marinum]|uniref:Uncharacterized protein n=1 Tax=Pustulibacterium marinum TaxID=1224947 RepID=A0A1I7HCP3_9FLAO|nr:hypothetical protein SAMN05216480_108116 [Pustulibacterium marinum]
MRKFATIELSVLLLAASTTYCTVYKNNGNNGVSTRR